MTDTNIINMPTPLNILEERIRHGHLREQGGTREWIEGVLEVAGAMREAREHFKSNDVALGHWVIDRGLNFYNDDDRTAFANMGADLSLARIILEETQRRSIQLIWREEMKPRMISRNATGHAVDTIKSQNAQFCIQTAPENTPPLTLSKISTSIMVAPPPLPRQSPLKGRKRADEVYAIFQEPKCRVMIGKAINRSSNGARIWQLILQAIDAGFLTPSRICPSHPNLGVLFPDTSRSFRTSRLLTNKDDLKIIEEQIMPAAIANREAILGKPKNIEQIIREHTYKLHTAAAAEQQVRKIEAAKAAMKASETEVIIFGKTFWPLVDWDPDLAYDYEQLRSAVWIFRELHMMSKSTSDPSPKSSALHIRHAVKFMWRYADKPMRNVLHLIVDLSRALEANPDGHYDVNERLPTMPIIDREYD